MPRFSIIVVHYQGTVSREVFARGMNSIQEQSFKDFELLVYHDGPLLDVDAPFPVPVRCSEQRFNDSGHSLRDRGIREATGDYILHFNADNVLYSNALEAIDAELKRPPRWIDRNGRTHDTDNIAIFPIIMHDHERLGTNLGRVDPGSGVYTIMTGNPPAMGFIDCMQLVMRRELWLAEGGWRDKRPQGDGFMYPEFARKHGYRPVSKILGEHF